MSEGRKPTRRRSLAKTEKRPPDNEVEAVDLGEKDVAVTSGADQWVGEVVPPRGLVPTQREQEAGVERGEYSFELPRDREEKAPLGERVKKWAGDIDPRQIEGPKFPLLVMALLVLVGEWDDKALAIVLPEIRTEFGLSVAFLLTMGQILGVLQLLLAMPAGYLADRIKRIHMVRFGAITMNVSSIWQGVAPGIGHLIGARAVSGSANGVYGPAIFPLLTDYYPSRVRARVIGFIFIVGAFGGIVGPLLGGNLADAFGWRAAVISLGIIATAVSLMTFLLREPARGYWDRREMGESEATAVKEQKPIGWGEAWRAAASIATLRRLWFAEPFLWIGGLVSFQILPIYFGEVFQVSAAGRGYLQTLNAVVGLIALIISTPITDRLLAYRPGRVLTLGGVMVLVQASVYVVLGFSPNLAFSVLASIPMTFVGGLILPSLITVLSLVIPARMRGLGLQTAAPFRLAGAFLIILVSNATADWGLRGTMIAFGILLAIGAFIAASASVSVERDIRAARAAALAEEEMERARTSGRTKLLVCRDVDVTYEGTQVLFNVDFDVREGEVVAILGTNGAGKSSLLRAIAGLHEASNGAIFLDGRDVTHVPPHQNASNGVVFVPGGRAIFPTLTVEENLKAGAWLHREDDDYVKEGTEKVFDFFPALKERVGQVAGNLSGGEQQMLALGQVFLMKPRLLMIDELSLGLAPPVVEKLLETLRAINQSGTTIILVEQSINVALTIAERAVFMEKGEIRFDGPTRELLSKPDLVRAVFLGIEAAGATGKTSRRRALHDAPEGLLRVEELSVSFGGVKALDRVSLEVSAGEVVGVIGPNGAGKTSLFDAISGFVEPEEGRILFESQDLFGLGPDARARLGLGRSFQNAFLFPAMTVRENIAVALERHLQVKNPLLAAVWSPQIRKSERRAMRKVDELIRLMGLRAYADKFVDELSTGTRRAVDIACVLAAEPRVLLLDEPSSGLAQAETEELGPVLVKLVRDTGCGLLVIEHDMPLISTISDRMIAMELGTVITSGPPREVLNDPQVLTSYLAASSDVVARSGDVTAQSLIESVISKAKE